MEHDRTKQRGQRGKTITVDQFSAQYGLEAKEAQRLFNISGPSETDLRILMAAKGISPVQVSSG